MTLESSLTAIAYAGDGAMKYFDIPFFVLDKAHVLVSVCDEQGENRVLKEGDDYEVAQIRRDSFQRELSVVGINLKNPLPSGRLLVLERDVPITQDTVFHNQGPNSPNVIEKSLDKLTMICQQLQSGINEAEENTRTAIAEVSAMKADALHADRHKAGGVDSVTPNAIGAMPAAPTRTGVCYYARGNQWFEAGSGSLPSGGGIGDLLVNVGGGVGEWRRPDNVAGILPVATVSRAGMMAADDKKKLDAAGLVRGTVTLHVGAAGSDSDGNGTSANPFRTVDGVFAYLDKNYDMIGSLTIVCQAGSFAFSAGAAMNKICRINELTLQGKAYDVTDITFTVNTWKIGAKVTLQNLTLRATVPLTSWQAFLHVPGQFLHIRGVCRFLFAQSTESAGAQVIGASSGGVVYVEGRLICTGRGPQTLFQNVDSTISIEAGTIFDLSTPFYTSLSGYSTGTIFVGSNCVVNKGAEYVLGNISAYRGSRIICYTAGDLVNKWLGPSGTLYKDTNSSFISGL